jgi:hypothetical protein
MHAASCENRATKAVYNSVGLELRGVLGGLRPCALPWRHRGAGLFWAPRTQIEYLWLGAYLLPGGLDDLAFSMSHYGLWPLSLNSLIGDPALYLVLLQQVEFTFAFIQKRVSFAWRIYEILLTAGFVAAMPINWCIC